MVVGIDSVGERRTFIRNIHRKLIEIQGNLCRSGISSAESESVAADDSFPAAGREVDVFFPHTDSEDITCSALVIDQMSVLTHFLWAVGEKNKTCDRFQLHFLAETTRETSNEP